MKKYFCDVCGSEKPALNKLPVAVLRDTHGRVLANVRLTLEPIRDEDADLDVCANCVFDALRKLDDRPSTP